MAEKTYEQYMASIEWAERRAARLAIDSRRCRACHHDGSVYGLEVHHATYERLGCEDIERDLITLCAECHHAITESIRRRRYESRPVAPSFVLDMAMWAD